MSDFDFNFDFEYSPYGLDVGDEYVTDTTEQLPTPKRHDRRVAKRRFINGLQKQALTELIKELPPPDTDLYIIGNGSGGTYRLTGDPVAWEFGHFLPVLVDMLGGRGCIGWVSTWTMNRQHALNMLDMLDSGALAQLAVLTDAYFVRREAAVATALIEGLLSRGQRFLSFKNHTKIIALASADGAQTVSILSSGNLSSQPRAENFTLSTDPGLYEFLRDQFFEEMLRHGKYKRT